MLYYVINKKSQKQEVEGITWKIFSKDSFTYQIEDICSLFEIAYHEVTSSGWTGNPTLIQNIRILGLKA